MPDESFISEFKQSIQNLKNIHGTISEKYTNNVATIKTNLSGINEKVKILKKSIMDRVDEYSQLIKGFKDQKQAVQGQLSASARERKIYMDKINELQKQIDAKESQIQTANNSLQTKVSESNELQQQIRILTT